MKTEFADINETRKSVRVEVPSDVVDAEISRLVHDYSRKARLPGFRPGKVPPSVIRQRFRDQLLHDVAHDLVPRVIDDVLRERGVEPVDTPDVRDVTIEEGRPLTFTASFETVPSFEPGDYSTITLQRPSAKVADDAVSAALDRLRDRAAKYVPVEDRAAEMGDTVIVNLTRRSPDGKVDQHDNVTIEIGASANPPGLDADLIGLTASETKSFTLHFPADYGVAELAGTDADYTVTANAIKKRVRPELDDEFAKDLGEFATLDDLRARVRGDLEHEARHESERHVRAELMKQLAARVPFEVPPALVDREIDRRMQDFAGRLMDQNIDPRQAGIDWNAFRDSQREISREAVAASLALDEVARREQLDPTAEEVDREVTRYAERIGRTPAAVRAQLEKEGGLSRVHASLRQEKSIDFVMARATISGE